MIEELTDFCQALHCAKKIALKRKASSERERDVSSKKLLTDSKKTFSSKVSNLDIEDGLELSLLGGLIDTIVITLTIETY